MKRSSPSFLSLTCICWICACKASTPPSGSKPTGKGCRSRTDPRENLPPCRPRRRSRRCLAAFSRALHTSLSRRGGLLGGEDMPVHRENHTKKCRQGPAGIDWPVSALTSRHSYGGDHDLNAYSTGCNETRESHKRGSHRGALSPVKYACSSLVSMLGRTPSRFCTYKTQNPSTE